jgi:glycerophosphoryl diester phosphodiesterase
MLILTPFCAYNQSDSVRIYGHRGCRGLLPENSIEAFKKAIELEVYGVEWDVVVNKDKQLVISHEPYFNADFCLDSNNVAVRDESKFNMYELTQAEIEQFDCGSRGNTNYPEQQKTKTVKPLLKTVFAEVDFSKTEILFEIKSEKKEYGISQPFPTEFATLILNEVNQFEYKEQIVFMSFDAEMLNVLHTIAPEYRYVYLTYLPAKSAKQFLKEIDFNPYALGMLHITITKRKVKQLRTLGIETFAWTVNKNEDAKKLKEIGVNGLITDYPDRIK